MFKVKEVEVFSYDTIRTGLEAYFKTLILSIPLIIIPFGFLLYFNLAGWVALNIYDREQVKFFSRESLSVGWNVVWRYYAFILPLLPLSIIPVYVGDIMGFSPYIWGTLLVITLLSSCVIAEGWAVERVGFIRYQADADSAVNQMQYGRLSIKNVLKASAVFFKEYWVILLPATMLTSGIAEAIVRSYGLPIGGTPEDLKEHLVWMSELLISMVGYAILEGMVVLLALSKDSQQQRIRLPEIIERLLPKLPVVLIVAAISAILIGLGILLLIPGIIALFWLFFVIQVAVAEEKQGVIDILKRSKALVRGQFWRIIALLLVMISPYLAALIIGEVAGVKVLLYSGIYSVFIDYALALLMAVIGAVITTFAYLELTTDKEQAVD